MDILPMQNAWFMSEVAVKHACVYKQLGSSEREMDLNARFCVL